VLIAADLPLTDRQFLGERGVELCRHVPLFSAYQLNDNNYHHNGDNNTFYLHIHVHAKY